MKGATTEGRTNLELNLLGTSDLLVSRVGLGCNNFGARLDAEQTEAVVLSALGVGVNFFDTAEIYGDGNSERPLGRALRGHRAEVVVATKFGWNAPGSGEMAGSPANIRRALDDSLRRLQTDYVDLFYYHRPDGVTPIADTLEAMNELVQEGSVRWIGCSNFDAGQLDEAELAATTLGISRFVVVQNEYSLLDRLAERDVLPWCDQHGVGFVPYFPLANGLLTGKYRHGQAPPPGTRLEASYDDIREETFREIEALERFAEACGHTLLELAIAGLT